MRPDYSSPLIKLVDLKSILFTGLYRTPFKYIINKHCLHVRMLSAHESPPPALAMLFSFRLKLDRRLQRPAALPHTTYKTDVVLTQTSASNIDAIFTRSISTLTCNNPDKHGASLENVARNDRCRVWPSRLITSRPLPVGSSHHIPPQSAGSSLW